MIKVRRLGHATISTPDMDGQIDYYGRILGLRVAEKSKDRAILVSKQGFEAIELVKGEQGQLKRISFQIAPGTDLNDVVKELQKLGIKPHRSLEQDMQLQTNVMSYGGSGTTISLPAPAKSATEKKTAERACACECQCKDESGTAKSAEAVDFSKMTAAEKMAWHKAKWDRVFG